MLGIVRSTLHRPIAASTLTLAVLATVAISLAPEAVNASGVTYDLPRSETTLRVDAYLDEPAWQDAFVFELDYETRPIENGPAPVRTVCRMLYTETHLYYGCEAF